LRERRRLKYKPLINETLALEVVTGGQIKMLKRLARACPQVMSDCICEELSCITGSAHQHLSDVACELRLLERWTRQLHSRSSLRRCKAVRLLASLEPSRANSRMVAALADDDEQVRIEAARALVRWGDQEEIQAVLKFAASQPLLLRALVAEDLRPVVALCEPYLSPLLCSDDVSVVAGALDIIEAWQKTLSIPGFRGLLNHPATAVRVKALRLAPYVHGADAFEPAVLEGLLDENCEVRVAAAYAAGRMGLRNAIPRLQSLIQANDDRVALAAAEALARLGGSGIATLEAEVLAGGRCAPFALEAMEKAQLGLDLRVPA
jgi:HEAT repeat protein